MDFKGQLELGSNVLKTITGEDDIGYSSAMKLVFANLNPVPYSAAKEGFVQTLVRHLYQARITTNGLLMEGHLYPFTDDFQKTLHQLVLKQIINNADTPDDGFDKLKQLHQLWKNFYISGLMEQAAKVLWNKQLKKMKEYRDQQMYPYMGQTYGQYIPQFMALYYPGMDPVTDVHKVKEIDSLRYAHEFEHRKLRDVHSGKIYKKNLNQSTEYKKIRKAYNQDKKQAKEDYDKIEQTRFNTQVDRLEALDKVYESNVGASTPARIRRQFESDRKKGRREVRLWSRNTAIQNRADYNLKKEGLLENFNATLKCTIPEGDSETLISARNSALEEFDKSFAESIMKKFGCLAHNESLVMGTQRLFKEDFERSILSSKDVMTLEEIEEYHSFSRRLKEMIGVISKDIRRVWKPKLTRIKFKGPDDDYTTHRHFPVNKDNKSDHHQSHLTEIFSHIRLAIRQEIGNEYFKTFEGEAVRKLSPGYFFNVRVELSDARRDHTTIPNIKQEYIQYDLKRGETWLFNFLKALFEADDVLGYVQLFDDYVVACRRYYSDLMIRYREELKIFSAMPSNELRDLRADIDAKNEAFKKALPKYCKYVITAEIDKILQKLVKILSDEDVPKENIVVLPTGFIVGTDNGVIAPGHMILDERIRAVFSDSQWNNWKKAWSLFHIEKIDKNKSSRKYIDEFDNIVCRSINQHVFEQTEWNYPLLELHEQQLMDLQDEHGFDVSPVIEVSSGRLSPFIPECSILILEDILSTYGKYISLIDFTPTTSKMDLVSIMAIMKQIMGGERESIYPFVSVYNNKIQLSMSILQQNFDNAESAFEYISVVIGSWMYAQLNAEEKKEFGELVEHHGTVSKMAFYRLTGKRNDSPIERQKHTVRILFIIEFNKFIHGVNDDGNLNALFQRIEKIRGL